MSSELRVDKIVPVDGVPTGGGGGIVQLKSVTHTEMESQALTGVGNFFDIAGMTLTITPHRADSKIFVMTTVAVSCNNGNRNTHIRLQRGSSAIAIGTEGSQTNSSFFLKTRDNFSPHNISVQFLDSPASTSAVTYKVQWSGENSDTFYLNRNASSSYGQNEGMVSTLTLMEVSA